MNTHILKDTPQNDYFVAIAFVLQQMACSREVYAAFREVQIHLGNADNTKLLPKKYETLQQWLKAELPLILIYKKSMQLDPSKVVAGQAAEGPMFCYNPVDIVENILNTDHIRNLMYFRMTMLVDNPLEL